MELTLEMFDRLGIVVWEMDPRGLNLVSIGDQVEVLSGLPASRWCDGSASFLDFIHPADRPAVLKAFTGAIEQCTWDRLDFRIAAGTGARWVRSTFGRSAVDGRLVGTMVDISQWHELTESEHRYRAMVTHSVDATALLGHDGVIRFVTDAVERISGYTAAELIGRNAFEHVHPDDRARVRDAFLSALAQPGVALSVEYRARHKDGSWHHREVIGVNRLDDPDIASIIVNYRDTTARRQAEAALARRERVHQSTFDEALIGIAHSNLDGRFLLVNRRLCELLGYSAEELTALDFMAISHQDEVGQDIDAKARLIAGDIDRYTREKRYRRKDGSFVSTNLTVSVHRDLTGEPAYFIDIIEDLTERKHLEQQVRQAHKMEAVGRLAGGIAHDFNNLLTAILGFAELALKQLNPEEHPVRNDIEEIRAAGRSAALLTQQLLAFSRRQILQPQVVDLNTIVGGMTGLLARLIGENINVKWALATPLDRVSADPNQIQQVVLNLALNARDAMPQGGTLSIETHNVELDATYAAEHPGAMIGPHVMLAITDTGVGIEDGVREYLFEPFYTTKGLGQGTGLGLATVYGIVKQSGGSIFVISRTGEGTTFQIFLPRTDRQADAVEAPELLTGPLEGSETVLVVEDQSEVRSVARETLTRYGYTVVEAANSLEALAAVGHRGRRIQLLLLDVVLPGMSGPTLARVIVRHRPEIQVLYMSGYASDSTQQRLVLDSGAAFIRKPFGPDELLRKVRDVLGNPIGGSAARDAGHPDGC